MAPPSGVPLAGTSAAVVAARSAIAGTCTVVLAATSAVQVAGTCVAPARGRHAVAGMTAVPVAGRSVAPAGATRAVPGGTSAVPSAGTSAAPAAARSPGTAGAAPPPARGTVAAVVRPALGWGAATVPRLRTGPGRPTRPAQRGGAAARAERMQPRGGVEPSLPDGLDPTMLDRSVRAELRSLTKPNAEVVGAHLLAAGMALESDPARALAHARAARARASRLAIVRETVGVAAYHAEEWTEALTELRTARRISGDPRNLPLLADCERALGRPTQALRMLSDPDVNRLDPETRAELLLVIAGARRDLGQPEAALSVLARGGLDTERPKPGSVRVWYFYADILAELGRAEEAARWFAAAAALDVEGETDAAERAADLL